MTDRDTGLTVTLPLVWRDGILFHGTEKVGYVCSNALGRYAVLAEPPARRIVKDFPTLEAAKAAVERAVMERLGKNRR